MIGLEWVCKSGGETETGKVTVIYLGDLGEGRQTRGAMNAR